MIECKIKFKCDNRNNFFSYRFYNHLDDTYLIKKVKSLKKYSYYLKKVTIIVQSLMLDGC